MASDERLTLSEQLGRVVRARRTAAALRQDDIASAARHLGLDWSRAVVAAFESGRRALLPEELLLLPTLLRWAGISEPVELADLLAAIGPVTTSAGYTVHPQVFLKAARGESGATTMRDLTGTPARAAADAGMERLLERFREYERYWPKAPFADVLAAEQSAGGEAEQKAARRFGVDPVIVGLVAHRLWGRSLTAERDARVGHPTGASQRSLQTMRGHATRQLLDELGPYITEA